MGIYIWGTGCSAGDLFQQGLDPELVTAFIETAPSKPAFLGRPVLCPEQLHIQDVELLLIASQASDAIYEQCRSLGLAPDCLFFVKNQYVLHNRNASCTKASRLLPSGLLERLEQTCRIIREPAAQTASALSKAELEADYVRVKTLELMAPTIRQVPGALAELGVYRGFFAAILNRLFPERTLHLFDTFDGFDPAEAQRECAQNNCTASFLEAHKNTSAYQVLQKMPYPEQVILHPGIFPASLCGLETSFALISLDADFEDSTYAGLSYFWPRLNDGGYLLLHDYNSPNLTGVKKAVERYEQEHGMRLPGVPLCDINGTLILCKPTHNFL